MERARARVNELRGHLITDSNGTHSQPPNQSNQGRWEYQSLDSIRVDTARSRSNVDPAHERRSDMEYELEQANNEAAIWRERALRTAVSQLICPRLQSLFVEWWAAGGAR